MRDKLAKIHYNAPDLWNNKGITLNKSLKRQTHLCRELIKDCTKQSWMPSIFWPQSTFYCYFKCNLLLWCQSWFFSIITAVFITRSFRNQLNMLICCSRNYYYYQCWKQVCWFILLWKPWYIIPLVTLLNRNLI